MMTEFKEQEWLASHFRQRLSDLGNHIVRVKRVISEMLLVLDEDDLPVEFMESFELMLDELGRIQREVSTAAVREDLDESIYTTVFGQQHAAWSAEFDEAKLLINETAKQPQLVQRKKVVKALQQLERLSLAKQALIKSYEVHQLLAGRFSVPLNYRVWINSGLAVETLEQLEQAARQATTLAEFETLIEDIEIKQRKK
jgi:hypothetical protein